MSLPAVSVVIPAFNAGRWIESALESVVALRYPPDRLDVVVVDDGSDDGTNGLAKRVMARTGLRHTLLRNPSPQGPSAARNRGWRQAGGEWIQFLDADDLLAPTKLDVQVAVAAATDSETAGVFSTWAHLVQTNGQWISSTIVTPTIGPDALFDVLRADNFIATGSQIFRREWLDRVGGYVEPYRCIEDVDLLLRIVMAGGALRAAASDQPLFFYRRGGSSLSSSNPAAFIEGCIRNAELVERHWTSRHELTPERRRLLADVYFMGARFFAEHDRNRFEAVTESLFRVMPTFVPSRPVMLRWLSRVVGYRFAERCAIAYRRLRPPVSRESQVTA